MKAEKLPSGNWRVRVYLGTVNGKKKMKSITGRTKQEALRNAAMYVPIECEDMTVEDAVRQYLELKEAVLSPSTYRSYREIAKTHIYPDSLSRFRLTKLSTPTVQRWVSALALKLSPKSVRNCYGLFTASVNMFYPDVRFRVRLPQRKKPELYTPSTDDVNAILAAADPQLRLAIGLAINAMMRRGEICALTAEDVDFLRGRIRINKSMARTYQGGYVIKPPKTNSSNRTIEINRELLALFPREGRIVPLTPAQVSDRFAALIKRTGLPPFRFHDLRHYAASIAVSSAIGAGKLTIQGRGGWESDHVLKSTYEHSVREQEARDTAAILSFYSKNIHFGG